MKIAVCDDSREDSALLTGFIQRYCEINCIHFELDTFYNREDLFAGMQNIDYDTIFLDIFLGDDNGAAIAREIRRTNETTALVFVTSSLDYMAAGYDVQVLHYLQKPVTYEMTENAMKRCCRFSGQQERYIQLDINRTQVCILLRDILYAEVFDTATYIHTASAVHKVYMPLGKLEKQLAGSAFYRCHRSYLIHFDYVQEVLPAGFMLKNGDTIPFRKHSRPAALQAYHAYLFEKARNQDAYTDSLN